jgi:glycosyltransferase involved in cell wall biosynthesis
VLSAKKNYAVSPPFARILDDFFGKGKYTWEVMPNMVNRQFLECPLPTKSGTQPFCFLNVATLDTKKRQENLIAAFATEFRNDDSVQLVIAGDGPERQNLQELAQRSGVSDRIHFLGKLTRMGVLNAMSHASAFVLSSRYETFGVVLIESLALGVPVIATRCGGPESIVQEGDGVLVPVDDVPALAAAMRQLYQSHEEYDAEGIRERCRARFSEQVVSSMLMDRYNRVLSDHRPDARRGAT